MPSAKIQAIELREAGLPVREVAARTGLSVPTVVALHKTFLAGGMVAVLARRPGRPRRAQQNFSQGVHEAQTLMGLRPEAWQGSTGEAPALWSLPLLAQWLQSERKKPVNTRAAARLWRQWGWAPVWPDAPAAGTWQARVHGPVQGGGWLLCCRSPRQSVYWLSLNRLPSRSQTRNQPRNRILSLSQNRSPSRPPSLQRMSRPKTHRGTVSPNASDSSKRSLRNRVRAPLNSSA